MNKDIFGYNTLTGSIYLAAENDADLSDWYNLIYGHHMENGAMFGDIEKYLDADYFDSHSSGILQTAHGNYSIRVFACIRTNAYEDAVYQLRDDAEAKFPALKSYIAEHAVQNAGLPEDMADGQIIGMSTCSDAVTDGRIVLFASIAPWDDALDGSAAERINTAESTPQKPQLLAVGHKLQSGRWSFLNLMCVVCTFLTLLPLWALGRKYGQLSYSRKTIRRLEKQAEENDRNTQTDQNDPEQETTHPEQAVTDDLKHFLRKCRIGILLEILILIAAVIVFLMTEDLTGRMGIRDRWTGWMILIAAAALLADFICLRYRGKRPEETEIQAESAQ